MEIPSLPTDNLYKFLAIGGIIVMVAGFVLPATADFQIVKLHEEQQRLAYEEFTKHTGDLIRQNNEEMRIAVEAIEKIAEPKARDNILDLLNKRNVTKEQSDAFVLHLSGFVDEMRLLRLAHQDQRNVSQLLKYFGFAISALGFGLWYWKVQRFHDRTSRAEALKAEAELKAGETKPAGELPRIAQA